LPASEEPGHDKRAGKISTGSGILSLTQAVARLFLDAGIVSSMNFILNEQHS
jgi:hypothetical protein